MSSTTVFYNDLEITGETVTVDFQVGRSRELDDFLPVAGLVRVTNYNRDFDPPFFTTPFELLQLSGDTLLQLSGDTLLQLQGSQASGSYGVIEIGGKFVIKDGAVTVFTGHVEDVNYTYTNDRRVEAEFILGDRLTSLAASTFTSDWQTSDNQLSGARITEALGRADIDLSAYIGTINSGTIHLQGDLVVAGTNVLDYMRLIARTEHGKLWVDPDGLIQFRDRYTFPSTTPVADFDDIVTNFNFSGVSLSFGAELRAWQAVVTRLGGQPKTGTAAASPPANIGPRGITRDGLLFRTDEYSESLANYLANKFSDPEAVVASLDRILANLGTSDRATIAAIEIDEVVTLTWTPTQSGSQVTQTLVVEGVRYQADSSGMAVVGLQLAAYPNTNYFTYDTDSYDSGVPYGF